MEYIDLQYNLLFVNWFGTTNLYNPCNPYNPTLLIYMYIVYYDKLTLWLKLDGKNFSKSKHLVLRSTLTVSYVSIDVCSQIQDCFNVLGIYSHRKLGILYIGNSKVLIS